MNKKILYTILFLFVFLFIILISLRFYTNVAKSNKMFKENNLNNTNTNTNTNTNNNNKHNSGQCVPDVKERTVRGTSMTPFLKDGVTVKVDFSYYNCGKVPKNGDVIIYNFKARKMHLIKVVKVVPGDKFKVNKEKRTLSVNGREIVNKENKIYRFNRQNIKMLSLYEKSFKGVMKDGMCFIFGDKPGGIDSGKFGAVKIKDILGKVLIN